MTITYDQIFTVTHFNLTASQEEQAILALQELQNTVEGQEAASDEPVVWCGYRNLAG